MLGLPNIDEIKLLSTQEVSKMNLSNLKAQYEKNIILMHNIREYQVFTSSPFFKENHNEIMIMSRNVMTNQLILLEYIRGAEQNNFFCSSIISKHGCSDKSKIKNNYKIAVVGDIGTGKSTICKLMNEKNNECSNNLTLLEVPYQKENTNYYEGIRGIFIVIDLLKIETFRGAIGWKKDLYSKYLNDLEYHEDVTIPIILLFNKADNLINHNLQNNEITYSDCEEFCDKYDFKFHYYVCSERPQCGMQLAYDKMLFLCGKIMFPSYNHVDNSKDIKIDLLLKDGNI